MMRKSLFTLLVMLVVLMMSGCTTYALYIEPDTAEDLEIYPLGSLDGGRRIRFDSYTADVHSGFGVGVGFTHVLNVAGKSRNYAFTLLENGVKRADVEGEYAYGKASGSIFSGALQIEATFKNRITGTVTFHDGLEPKLCSVMLSLEQERFDGEQIGTITCGEASYRITARTGLISESGRIWYRDEIQGYTVWDEQRVIAVVSTRKRDPFVGLNPDLSQREKRTAAVAAALLTFRSRIEF
jgi:hypothetical protein